MSTPNNPMYPNGYNPHPNEYPTQAYPTEPARQLTQDETPTMTNLPVVQPNTPVNQTKHWISTHKIPIIVASTLIVITALSIAFITYTTNQQHLMQARDYLSTAVVSAQSAVDSANTILDDKNSVKLMDDETASNLNTTKDAAVSVLNQCKNLNTSNRYAITACAQQTNNSVKLMDDETASNLNTTKDAAVSVLNQCKNLNTSNRYAITACAQQTNQAADNLINSVNDAYASIAASAAQAQNQADADKQALDNNNDNDGTTDGDDLTANKQAREHLKQSLDAARQRLNENQTYANIKKHTTTILTELWQAISDATRALTDSNLSTDAMNALADQIDKLLNNLN